MSLASGTSPFSVVYDEPWIVWQQKASISALQESDASSPQSCAEDEQPAPLLRPQQMTNHETPQIRRSQYNAVLNRINQASRNTGTYAAWNA